MGISHVALLFRRCVPSIESVGMYNGTTINGIQGDALRLPRRGISPPRNDMLELPLQERTGQKTADKDDCLCLCVPAAGLARPRDDRKLLGFGILYLVSCILISFTCCPFCEKVL